MLTERIFVIFTIEPCWLNLDLRTHPTCIDVELGDLCPSIRHVAVSQVSAKILPEIKKMWLSSSSKGITLQGRSWNKCLSARLGLLTRCPMILPRFQTPWKKMSLISRHIGCMSLWFSIKSSMYILGLVFVFLWCIVTSSLFFYSQIQITTHNVFIHLRFLILKGW